MKQLRKKELFVGKKEQRLKFRNLIFFLWLCISTKLLNIFYL